MFNSNTSGYSLSDIAAASGRNDGFGGEGGAWWIIILFLFCFAGWGGNGFGNTTNDTLPLTAALDTNSIKTSLCDVNSNLLTGFGNTNASLLSGFAGVNQSLANGFANMTNGLNSSTQAIQSDLCSMTNANLQNTFGLSTQMNTLASQQVANTNDVKTMLQSNAANLAYNLASEACDNRRTTTDGVRDIIDNNNTNTRAILDFLTQTKIDELSAENASLRSAASQAEQNTYLISQLGAKTPVPAYIVQSPYASYSACGSCASSAYNF